MNSYQFSFIKEMDFNEPNSDCIVHADVFKFSFCLESMGFRLGIDLFCMKEKIFF